jgi:hypothetical protein
MPRSNTMGFNQILVMARSMAEQQISMACKSSTRKVRGMTPSEPETPSNPK